MNTPYLYLLGNPFTTRLRREHLLQRLLKQVREHLQRNQRNATPPRVLVLNEGTELTPQRFEQVDILALMPGAQVERRHLLQAMSRGVLLLVPEQDPQLADLPRDGVTGFHYRGDNLALALLGLELVDPARLQRMSARARAAARDLGAIDPQLLTATGEYP